LCSLDKKKTDQEDCHGFDFHVKSPPHEFMNVDRTVRTTATGLKAAAFPGVTDVAFPRSVVIESGAPAVSRAKPVDPDTENDPASPSWQPNLPVSPFQTLALSFLFKPSQLIEHSVVLAGDLANGSHALKRRVEEYT
jgi:hypothetical protein